MKYKSNGSILILTKNQHYVPQFYLRNFSSNERSIVLYRIKSKRPPVRNAAIKNICSEDYFYDRDNSIEAALSQREDDWSAVLKEIIEQKQIRQLTDKTSLQEFVSYQYTRTRGLLNHVSSMVQKLLLYIFFQDKVLQANDEKTQKEVVIEEIQKFAKEYAKDSITPAWLLTMTDDMTKGISDLRITILDNQTSKNFITSDTPVIMINPFSADQVGFWVVGIVMIVPVSPKIAVIIYDDKIYHLNSDLYPLTNEDDVININKYTFLNAEEILLAADEADINSLIADQDLLTEKTDNDYRRLSEMLGNSISIMHTKSRVVWKSYPLSFLKLPECFNDTLEMCREAFPRKYDIKNRVDILMRIYLIPNDVEGRIAPIAEKLVTAGEISEEAAKAINRASLEKGWKVLLNFMDTYWNISDNDKILSRLAVLRLKKCTKVHFIEASSKPN